MNSIYKVAGSFHTKLKVYANAQVLEKLDELVSKALALFNARHLWENAAREDMYSATFDEGVDQQKTARALELVDKVYFSAVGLKNDAKDANGMTKDELATRKARLLDSCSRLKMLARNADPTAFRLLQGVTDAVALVPDMGVVGTGAAPKAKSPSFETFPVDVRPSQNLGEAFEDEEQNMTEYDPSSMVSR